MKPYLRSKDSALADTKALVFNIQKCSIHDGPGIRTIVFLKGCPLHCLWCANPESQAYGRELSENRTRCVGCGVCIEKCPLNCIAPDDDDYPVVVRDKCNSCGICTDFCYAKSKRFIGDEMSVEEVVEKIRRDKVYYTKSGGGVTFSGGEPLTHPKFLLEAAKACKQQGIDVAIETCGWGEFEQFAPALDYVDLVFMDIKEIDPEHHRRLTGQDNEKILDNLRRIDALGKNIILRTPVIPGCNDQRENLIGIAELGVTLPHVEGVELLAYHALGENKYSMLGMEYALKGLETPDDETMNKYVSLMEEILLPAGKKVWYENQHNT